MKEETLKILERAVERSTGMSAEEIRRIPISDFRKKIEKEKGKPIRFYSSKPKLLSKEEIDRMVDWALREDD
jgi:hypothetical protein